LIDVGIGDIVGNCTHTPSRALPWSGHRRQILRKVAFSYGEDRLLFEYAASISLGQSVDHPMWVPSPEQAERVRRENRWAWWRCWKAMALKESCVFLGTEDIPFNRRSLPRVLEQVRNEELTVELRRILHDDLNRWLNWCDWLCRR